MTLELRITEAIEGFVARHEDRQRLFALASKFREMSERGLVTPRSYDLPPLDTIGSGAVDATASRNQP